MTYLNEMKVLYIEDDTQTREALQRFLKRRCGKVIAVKDAESALEIIDIYKPDIIIVDLLLPGINGLDLIDRIHSLSHTDSPEIIITTTVSEVDTIINSIDRNIDAYILKPLDLNEMELKLEQIARKIYNNSAGKHIHSSYISEENRGVIGDSIRVDFLKLLKTKSGKGPVKVNVILQADSIELVAYDTLTPFEKNILSQNNNLVIVEQMREIFYKSIIENITAILREKSGMDFVLDKINIDIKRKTDFLCFVLMHPGMKKDEYKTIDI